MEHHITFLPRRTTDLTAADRELLAAAYRAAEAAHAPYSAFRVGAAARLANGEVIEGSNQENAAFPSGLCAERVLAFAAGAQHPGVVIEVMACVTLDGEKVEGAFSPCGGCRQVLLETEMRQESPLRMLFQGGREAQLYEVNDAASLLPFAFGAKGLGNQRS